MTLDSWLTFSSGYLDRIGGNEFGWLTFSSGYLDRIGDNEFRVILVD